MFDYLRALTKRAEAQHEYNRLMSREQLLRAQQQTFGGNLRDHTAQSTAAIDLAERDELNQLRAEKKAMLEHKAKVFDQHGGLRGIPRRDRTDLPTLRVNDLAGYLGRVNELLTLAGYATMPYEEDPEKTKKTAMAQHFLRAATQAAAVQSDLLALIADSEPEDTKWPADVMTAAMAAGKPPEAVNRIKPQCPICCDSVLLGGACPECGRSDVSDPFVNQRS